MDTSRSRYDHDDNFMVNWRRQQKRLSGFNPAPVDTRLRSLLSLGLTSNVRSILNDARNNAGRVAR